MHTNVLTIWEKDYRKRANVNEQILSALADSGPLLALVKEIVLMFKNEFMIITKLTTTTKWFIRCFL